MTQNEIIKEINNHQILCQRSIIRYFKFVNYIQNNTTQIRKRGFHKHHILPKSIFPKYDNLNNNKWNALYVEPRVHYLLHWLLSKAFGGPMNLAFIFMNTHTNKNFQTGSLYQLALQNPNFTKSFALNKGRSWVTNGVNSIFLKAGQFPPLGYYPGRNDTGTSHKKW